MPISIIVSGNPIYTIVDIRAIIIRRFLIGGGKSRLAISIDFDELVLAAFFFFGVLALGLGLPAFWSDLLALSYLISLLAFSSLLKVLLSYSRSLVFYTTLPANWATFLLNLIALSTIIFS
jgi:hypothetical protein